MTRFTLAVSAAALIALNIGPAMAKSDKGFVADAIKGDTSEISLGQLALTKGGAAGVKSFAQTLIDDHTTAKTQASSVAQTLSVASPSGLTPEAEKEIVRLQKLSGDAFDKEFVRYMVEDHEKDVTEFIQEAASGASPTKELAAQTLPTLEKHLQMAKALRMEK